MKKLFLITDSTANKVSYFHVMLLLLSLPFDRFYSHLILISLTIHTLINLNKKDIKLLFTLPNLILQSVFFVTVIGTLYTINKTQAFNEWSRQVVILLVPVIFCLNTLDLNKYRNNLLLVFALGCTATIIYLYVQVFITIKYYHLPVSAVFSSAFTNHNFSETIDMHATFFSMQIAVALVYLLYALIKETATDKKILYAFGCFVLMGGILQLSSKSVFAGLLIIVNVAIPYFLLTGRARIKYITVAASLSALIIAGIYNIDNFKSHYITDLQKDLSKASANELTDPRLARWGVALQLAAQAPVIGHGSGSEIQLLKEPFFQHKFYRSYLHELNAHNQFISFFIKTGIWGVLVYLAILFFGFRMATSKNDLLLFSFMVIITAVSFSENYLDVDKGVFFYSVFFSLFIFSHRLKIKTLEYQTVQLN
ncbi:MAG: O-antigen ligase family protein [Mucilaginibacter sp.]|nr:O-antigen ligase family protein [Mucilaginibacter sp.]